MKTEPQRTSELTQLCELIEHMSVAMLTNFEVSGAIVSRPMSPLEMDVNGALWFFTDRRSTKVEHLRFANLSFVDEDNGSYVSISGHGEIETDRARIERLWTSVAKLWFPEGPDSPNLALLKFIPDTAEFWDTPHSKMVRMLAKTASIVTGEPIAMGEHETLTALSKRKSNDSSAL